jgi:para-aminobenzoate synthetase component 1
MRPIHCEILDFPYSAETLLRLFRAEPHVFLLQSSQYNEHRGRYSFLGFDPFDKFVGRDPAAIDALEQKFLVWKALLPVGSFFSRSGSRSPVPFVSGIVGFWSYDYGRVMEGLPSQRPDDLGVPYGFWGFYDRVLALDHKDRRLYVMSTGLPETSQVLQARRARGRNQYVVNKLRAAEQNGFLTRGARKAVGAFPEKQARAGRPVSHLVSNVNRADYLCSVQKALDYIRAGEIYQVNLSQRFTFSLEDAQVNPVDIYTRLTHLSPGCFGGYLDCGEYQIISSSPERFLNLKGDTVRTRPMKGTYPRGKDAVQDHRHLAALITSPKEKAELLMITDLLRNDIGRVCRYGSVQVQQLRHIEQYKTVFQGVAAIKGTLRPDQNAFNLIKACFPGGSITGCPKRRAMQIIDELEPTQRSVYTGSLGYVDFSGDMDLNILIRTLLQRETKLDFQVGGGIVHDSVPEQEYEETLVKARAMRACLEQLSFLKTPGHKKRSAPAPAAISLGGQNW